MLHLRGAFTALTVLATFGKASADPMAFEDFKDTPTDRWAYIADGVMGGVSEGRADFGLDAGRHFVRLSGTVSTENNGGFIQVRRLFPEGFPNGTGGLQVETRGNGEAYYLFIRTEEMSRPWYYYNVAITPGRDWNSLSVPLEAFERSHAHLKETIVPGEVISLGIVAYGRDHDADISVSSLSFLPE